MSRATTPASTSGETSSISQVLPKGPVVRVLLVHCCSVEPWVCPCANKWFHCREEDFEIIKFIEDNAPFTMLVGKPWIERDQARNKEEEKVLDQ